MISLGAANRLLSPEAPTPLPGCLCLGLWHHLKASHSGLIPYGAGTHLGGLRLVSSLPPQLTMIWFVTAIRLLRSLYKRNTSWMFFLPGFSHSAWRLRFMHVICMRQQFIVIYCWVFHWWTFGCFWFGATMTISIKVILYICFYLEMEFAESRRGELTIFVRKSPPLPLYPPTNFVWGSDRSTSLSTLVIISLLKSHYYCSHSVSLITHDVEYNFVHF